MRGKTVLLGVTGGIAAYKSAHLCSLLNKEGADVWVVMTEEATRFIAPLTLQTLSRHPVAVDTFEERFPEVVSHIDLADRAELAIVAPATANLIAKMAAGIADDMLTTTLLATQAPILLAPAMNGHMYLHWTVQRNLELLRRQGVQVTEPVVGMLACGYEGRGKLAEPEVILQQALQLMSRCRDMEGLRLLVTAGGTREAIDPVRFLGNRSTGKMGYAVAEAGLRRGAEVILVSAPSTESPPAGVQLISVTSAQEMYDAVMQHLEQADILVKAAAVADYRPVAQAAEKIKKSDAPLHLQLERTPDILLEVGKRRRPGQVIVGFAAETSDLERSAKEKLERKNLDLIVANDVTKPGAGFDTTTNQVTILARDGQRQELPLMEKRELADRLLDEAMRRWAEKRKA